MPLRSSLAIPCVAFLLLLNPSGTGFTQDIDFNSDIRPILSNKCLACHGPDEENLEAGLRLDDPKVALNELESGEYAIVAGKPTDSELLRRVVSTGPDEMMPPPGHGKPLNPKEVSLLRRWISDGAKWSMHWAYERPFRYETPDVDIAGKPTNWVDNFIVSRLAQDGLTLAPEANKATLLRRVSFDLTGLPPTPEEVDAFLHDKSTEAWERVVDRLLSTEAHGERLAAYWLDLVRYADTVGYHGDQDHNIWPYRDWVINALITNMPFDQFTREQLAGDLLANPSIQQRVATGYNRLLQTSHEGGAQLNEYLAIYQADRIRNLSEVWFGATMGCCQCHNHKFDPYTMKDFYSMGAFFADIDEAKHFTNGGNSLPTRRDPELIVLSDSDRQRIAEIEELIRGAEAQQQSATGESAKQKTAEVKQQIDSLKKERTQIEDSAPKTMITASIPPRTVRLLPRGNWLDDSGPTVQPEIPEFLGSVDSEERASRLDLANWITDPKDGVGLLTARVFVNRFWYLMFGSGIARDLTDFGGQGEAPTHPELLDRLALEFVDSGWDIRHVLKLIAMSRTYRQSSLMTPELQELDPENRLYARQSRFRIPAESIRDNALAISGLLVRQVGGPSVKPYQPAGYYRHLNFPTRTYKQHDDSRQWRRGLYIHWQRQFLHPMLRAFDAPSREECTTQRPQSNTPLASLTLLNDPTFVEAARSFATQILKHADDDQARLDFAYRRALSRTPDEFERNALTKLLDEDRKQFQTGEDSARKLIGTGLSSPPDDVAPAEVAAWTAVARAILNLSETNTRN